MRFSRMIRPSILLASIMLVCAFQIQQSESNTEQFPNILSTVVDASAIDLYWKSPNGSIYGSLSNLKNSLEANNRELVFAMNGGMYMENRTPLGLFIEDGFVHTPLNTRVNAHGNFYLQPNGIFYLTNERKAFVCTSTEFMNDGGIKYATQSGPMLVVDGLIHPALNKGSKNVHIRNGVGILPDGRVLFAMSKELINFYDFASFFKIQGCANALYLDGFVSRAYAPTENWVQLDGNFGVIIGVTK